MNQQVMLSHGRDQGPSFAKLSALQWRILGKILTEYWVRAGRDVRSWERSEAQRVAWVRAMTRLVNRGLVARKKDELGDFVKLTVSEHDLYCGAMCAWERDEAHGRQAKDSPAWAIIAAIKAKERRRRYARKPQPAQPPHGSGTAQIGTVASALQFLAQQKPEGDITAQEIVAFLAMPTIPLGVALMHLDALKSSGQYDCILADARR